jgi:subtilase family serine protease
MRSHLKLALLALALLPFAAQSTTLRAAEKAIILGRASSAQSVTFSVYLPLQNRDELEQLLTSLNDPDSPVYHQWLTPAQFDARFALSPSSIQSIQQQLSTFGLTSTVLSPHHLQVTGSAAAIERALGTALQNAQYKSGKTTIVAAGPITPPSSLVSADAVITGLSGMIRMRSHALRDTTPQNRYSTAGPYWFDDLKQAYSYPSYQVYDGKGSTIGILMSGGYNPPDMALYFGHEKLAVPKFSEVDIDGGAPYDPNNSFETHLDMQQTGGMAPKAKIILYNIPDLSDASFIDGLLKILEDNKADVVNMSFGGPEIFYTAAYNGGTDFTYLLRAENDLFAQGNAQGISFVASSGDSGALSAVPVACFDPDATSTCGSFLAAAEFPASSPHVTGVGGTNLATTFSGNPNNLNSAYISEEAFADTLSSDIFYGTPATGAVFGSGGGDSILFRKPAYQTLVHTGNARFRTVPDLSLHMGGCPVGAVSCSPDDSADIAVIGGEAFGAVGTSASAVDFTGLTALTVQRFGTRLGNQNQYIYSLAVAQSSGFGLNVFRTRIPGFNGLFSTTPNGYNRVLGNGTLRGTEFLLAPLIPTAGTPQTPSNP